MWLLETSIDQHCLLRAQRVVKLVFVGGASRKRSLQGHNRSYFQLLARGNQHISNPDAEATLNINWQVLVPTS